MRTYFYDASNAPSLVVTIYHNKRIFKDLGKWLKLFIVLLQLGIPILNFASSIEEGKHPCTCESYTPIGENSSSITSLAGYGGLEDNTCYIVYGKLVVDDADACSGSRFLMTEGSQIFIEEQFNLSGCLFSSCNNEMWYGFVVSGSGTFNILDSYIEGAGIGISLLDGASIGCKNNTFVNDYIGIAVGNPFDEDEHGIIISIRDQITGCSFYTQDHLPDPYFGFDYEEWPTEPEGIQFDQGYAAVYLSGLASKISFGVPDAVDAERNVIHNMRNGVILRNSNCDISGSDFYDFEGEIPIAITADIPTINQQGVLVYFSESTITHNTFNNIMCGVHTEYSISYILDNEMEIVNEGDYVSSTYGISAEFPIVAEINRNTITNGYHGISLNDASDIFEISDNVLTRDVGVRYNAGIIIRSAKVSTEEISGLVHSNDIDINDGVAALGIYANTATYVRVNYNNINFYEVLDPWKYNVGILVAEGGQSIYSDNNIWADPVYKTDSTNTAIQVFSQDNEFTCNDMDNMHRLMKFYRPNTMTQLIKNKFYNSYIGLHLIGQVSLGYQNHNLNKWKGYFNGYGAALSGPTAFETSQSSTFYGDPDDGDLCEIIPCAIYPSTLADDWFVSEENPGGPEIECPVEIDFTGNEEDSISALILRPVEFSEYNDQAEWMIKADLFEMILRDPGLRSNHIIDSFYDVEEDNNLGKLVLYQNALSSQYGIDPDRYEKQDSIIRLSDNIHDLDSILFDGPVNYLTLSALRNLKRDTLSRVFEGWLSMIEDQSHDSRIEYSDIQGDLALLTPDNDLEEYMIEALRLKSKCLLHAAFSSGDSTSLFSLVELCPMEGGRALGIAHDVYTNLMDSTIAAHIYPCPEPSPFVIYKPQGEIKVNKNEFVAWPNPASDYVNLSSNKEIFEVSLTDWAQHQIFREVVNSNQHRLRLNSLSPGLYVIRIVTESGIENRIVTIAK